MSLSSSGELIMILKSFQTLICFSLFIAFILQACENKGRLYNTGYAESKNMSSEVSKQIESTCPSTEGEIDPATFLALEKKANREMFGYPTEISLNEAVKIFNDELKCSPLYRSYPPLTEDEVIASIVAGADYGKQGEIWLAQKNELWRIASLKMMPKGSLLTPETGSRVVGSSLEPNGTIVAKGLKITVILGIDSVDGLKKIPSPEQTLIIRKSFSGIEKVK